MTETNQPSTFETRARLILAKLPEWQKLLTHFDLADEGFAFIPLFVPDASWADVCKKVLAEYLLSSTRKIILDVPVKEPDDLRQIATTLFALQTSDDIGAVWVAAAITPNDRQYEIWLSAWREGMARLNQYRNPFREKFDVPVLLVGVDWVQQIISNMAPDLWSVRTIVVRIEPPVESTTELQVSQNITPEFRFGEGLDIDPEYALREANRLRGQEGKELLLASILNRAASGFSARAKYPQCFELLQESISIYREQLKRLEPLKPDNTASLHDIEADLAGALVDCGFALGNLGRFREILETQNEAVEIYERLIKDENQSYLANDLVAALMNKATALDSLGRSNEALIEYDKAIEIRDRLVNEEGRDELANDLAMALMNKAVALWSLGRSNEALIEYDKVIEIRDRLVNEEGRDELANYLAAVLMNKALALWSLGRSNEALIEYDKAIEIRDRLVNEEGRDELANDLAMALMNKAVALRSLERFDDALTNYNEAVRLYEGCIRQGRWELLPRLLRTIGLRIETRLKLNDHDEAAKDTGAALGWLLPFIESAEIHEDLKAAAEKEFFNWVGGSLRRASEEEREEVIRRLSEKDAELIRQILSGE